MVRASPVVKYLFFLIFPTPFHRATSDDERDYPEPREFRPERFLRNGKLNPLVRDMMDAGFGFGGRYA